jgi:hypothetical protein
MIMPMLFSELSGNLPCTNFMEMKSIMNNLRYSHPPVAENYLMDLISVPFSQ